MKDFDLSKIKLKSIIKWSLIVIIGLWGSNLLMIFVNSGERGTIGDMFGAVNALFSGLAFAGIIITIYLQMSELKEQRKELQMTRATFDKQLFESTFFEMLKIHNQNTEAIMLSRDGIIEFNGKKGVKELIKIIKELRQEIIHRYRNYFHGSVLDDWNELNEKDLLNICYYLVYRGTNFDFQYDRSFDNWLDQRQFPKVGLSEAYLNKYYAVKFDELMLIIREGTEQYLSNYFRHMFQLVKYVHDADDSFFLSFESAKWTLEDKLTFVKQEKYRYLKNLRSQLSLDQQLLLAINAISDFGKEWRDYKGIDLIKEYQLIKNLNKDDLGYFGVSLEREFPGVRFYE